MDNGTIKMNELIKQLNKASYAYYALDKPIMTDKAYDDLYNELETLEQETGIVLAGSPTQKTQGFVLDGFAKVEHSKPMLSADKTKDINDISKFVGSHDWYCSGKLDGCFPEDARVKMADGTEKKIIDVKVGDYVASYNETTNIVEPKKVIRTFENGRKPSNEWVRIKLYSKFPFNNSYYMRCTKNHLILTTNGWVEAGKLQIGDKVYRYGYVLSKSQNEFLVGSMLGDGFFIKKQKRPSTINTVECHYSKVNKYPYDTMIDKTIELFDFNTPKVTQRKSGYGSEMIDVNFHTMDNKILANKDNALRCGITFTDEVLNQLTPLSLAILYIDDGSRCTCLDDGYTCTLNRQVRCRIAVNRHPDAYVKAFSEWMSNNGYYNRVVLDKPVISDNNSSGCYIELNVEGTKNFFDAIAPYVPKEIRNIKLGLKDEWQNCEEVRWWENKGHYGVIEGEIVEIIDGLKTKYRQDKGLRNRKPVGYQSYDLEVEDNHTYFVNNYVVHNCTLVTKYSGGDFVQGVTRGNGLVGEDVTATCRFIKNLPMHIPYDGELEIRGECVMSWDEFNRINEQLDDKYSHPRNLAAGTLRQLDLNITKQRELSFVAFECVTDYKESKLQCLSWLNNLGFETVVRMASDCGSVEEVARLMTETVEKDKYPYDGLVFEIDSKTESIKLGATGHHENCRMALKWKDTTYETVLRGVEWSVGKSGVIFPTGVVDEVDLDGALTSRVTLHNITYIKELELGIGDTVTLYRSNRVIPAIDENLTRSNNILIPDHCPVCNGVTKIIQQNSSKVLYCTNPHCQGKLLGKLTHYVSRQGMDIDGLSEQTLKVLIKIGAVNNFVGLYNLRAWKSRLIQLPGFGAKSVNKLLDNIDKSAANVDLAHFICALSIPNIGTGQAKVLAKKFKTWDALVNAVNNNYDFTQLVGFGNVANDSIHDWFDSQDDIAFLVSHLVFRNDDPDNASNADIRNDSVLGGKVFVITGKLKHFNNREQLVNLIQANGGSVAASVTKNTNFLINNDAASGSSKNKKAKELGIKIITEDEFLNMVKG